LQLKLIPEPVRHTPNFPAYEALLKARHHMGNYQPEAHTRAEEYCRQAISLDPEYAAPHALLSFHYLFAATHTGNIREVAPLIRREALRSLELDPSATGPHFLLASLASVHDYDWPQAAIEFRMSLAGPSPPAEAHWAYASLYLNTFGRFEEAAEEMRRGVEQDPLTVGWRGVVMCMLINAGRYEEALVEGQKALDISQAEIHPFMAMGEAYLGLGRVAEAAACAERAHRNFPQHSMGAGLLAACLVRQGERSRADLLLQEMGDLPTPLWGRAWFHLLCGEVDAGAEWFEKMIEARDMFTVMYVHSPYTKDLRASPRWAKLARMMNLER
jgi:tetratricopeptide (TPR) repeat protein